MEKIKKTREEREAELYRWMQSQAGREEILLLYTSATNTDLQGIVVESAMSMMIDAILDKEYPESSSP